MGQIGSESCTVLADREACMFWVVLLKDARRLTTSMDGTAQLTRLLAGTA